MSVCLSVSAAGPTWDPEGEGSRRALAVTPKIRSLTLPLSLSFLARQRALSDPVSLSSSTSLWSSCYTSCFSAGFQNPK